mgnify:CR=1 FL=1
MQRAYQAWCKVTFPDYKATDFPYRGRMFEIWRAAWVTAKKETSNEKAKSSKN